MKLKYSEEEWKRILTPKQHHVLRQKGTELAFSGEYVNNKKKGRYVCAGCGNLLFSSGDKYESKSGWPSFTKPAEEEKIETQIDDTHYLKRTEVICSRCGGHLGHVFEDGPAPTGKRYCINSAALKFKEEK